MMDEQLITMAELAKLVNRDLSTVHQLRHAGVFCIIEMRQGRRLKHFVDQENVQKLIDHISRHAKKAAPKDVNPLTATQKKKERLARYRAELRDILGVV